MKLLLSACFVFFSVPALAVFPAYTCSQAVAPSGSGRLIMHNFPNIRKKAGWDEAVWQSLAAKPDSFHYLHAGWLDSQWRAGHIANLAAAGHGTDGIAYICAAGQHTNVASLPGGPEHTFYETSEVDAIRASLLERSAKLVERVSGDTSSSKSTFSERIAKARQETAQAKALNDEIAKAIKDSLGDLQNRIDNSEDSAELRAWLQEKITQRVLAELKSRVAQELKRGGKTP